MTAKRKLVFVQDMPSYQHSRKSSKKSSSTSVKTTNKNRIWPRQSPKSYLKFYDPFPAVAYATMRYSTSISITGTIGVATGHIFRANSLFDPDYTGIGHQPYGFDQYAAIYNHYEVIDSVITMTPIAGDANGIFGIGLEDDNSPETGYDTVKEQKGTKMSIYNSNGTTGGSVVNKYTAKFFPNKYQQSSTVTTNANDPFYFNCFYEAKNSTATPDATMNFLVTITYRAKFNELKNLGGS